MDRKKKPHLFNAGDLIPLGKNTSGVAGGSSGSSSSKLSSSGSSSNVGSSSHKSSSSSSSSKLFSVGSSSSSKSKSTSSSSSSDRKREGGSVSSLHDHPVKKSKTHHGTSSTSASSSSKSSHSGSSSSSSSKPSKPSKRESIDSTNVKPEELQKDVYFSELEKADKHNNIDRGQNLILAGIRKLRSNREKPDLRQCEILLLASQNYPQFITGSSSILDNLVSLATYKKSSSSSSSTSESKLKSAQQNLSIFAPVALNILANGYSKSSNWPTAMVQLWIEDSCGERHWVDSPHCKHIVDNIHHSFGTVLPSPTLLPTGEGGGPTGSLPSGASSPATGSGVEDSSNIQIEANQILADQKLEIPTQSRFSGKDMAVEGIINNFATELLTKKAPEIPKNLVKALIQACGLTGVREFVISKLEQWIHNPKCQRQAQELHLTVCVNGNRNTAEDNELVLQIMKLKMKTKPLILFHGVAIREMLRESEPVFFRWIMQELVFNELSNNRYPHNLTTLGSIVAGLPESLVVLAETFVELLAKRDGDFHPPARLLFREIMRNCGRYECDLTKFIKGLLKNDVTFPNEVKERAFLAIVDFITLGMFFSVSPAVREASMVRGDSKDQTILQGFRQQISAMQNQAILWLYNDVPTSFSPNKQNFIYALNKILLKDPANDILSKDGWPQDSDKTLFGRLSVDVPLSENLVIWLCLMSLNKEYPVLPREIMDILEFLVIRAASHKSVGKFEKLELYEVIIRMGEYRHPDDIILPEGYSPPRLAISKLFWQAWLILVILGAHNPQGIGKIGWDTYPNARTLMEMCMTNQFQFPTPGSIDSAEEILAKEMQICATEKHQILEFETHLAAASSKQQINERNSLLLSQLMQLEPFQDARNPPQQLLLQLQHLNLELNLGQLLCRSRNPDFLLDLIQKNSQPMPWLSDLVSEGSFDMLPIQCLCEFYLSNCEKLELIPSSSTGSGGTSGDTSIASSSKKDDLPEKSPRKHGSGKEQQPPKDKDSKITLELLHHLNNIIVKATPADYLDAREVLEYFLRRLSSPKRQNRRQASLGLGFLFSSAPFNQPIDQWLMEHLPLIHIFPEIKSQVIVLLRQALQVETEPSLIFKYVEFISLWDAMEDGDGGASLVIDISTLIVDRTLVTSVLFNIDPVYFEPFLNIFLGYMKTVRRPQQNEYRWSDNEDMMLVRWSEERLEAIINHQIIQAMILLIIAYSNLCTKLKKDPMIKTPLDLKFTELMDIWIPHQKQNAPKGFLLNTTEEAILFPTWLAAKMARTENARLMNAALKDLDVEGLLVFIQSFGFPSKSMSTLLVCLDKAVEQSPDSVRGYINNPKYLQSLVKVHWAKGIAGGKTFYQFLKAMVAAEEKREKESSKSSAGGGAKSKEKDTISSASVNLRPVLNIPSIKEPSAAARAQLKLNKSPNKGKKGDEDRKVEMMEVEGGDGSPAVPETFQGEYLDEETNKNKIMTLSKQLCQLLLPANSRRRSSVPPPNNNGGGNGMDDSLSLAGRRHSSYVDGASNVSSGRSGNGMSVGGGTGGGGYQNNLGELVDTITYVEPCIIRHAEEYQLPLLFGRNDNKIGSTSLAGQSGGGGGGSAGSGSFLMSVLTHQAGWETVEKLINLFLQEFNSSYDPASVLDLISATNSNPKLWQGLDKYVPRHQPNVSPFRLDEEQLVTMAEYILEEIGQGEMRTPKFSITNLLGPSQTSPVQQPKCSKAAKSGLQERVKLWLQCCQQDKDIVNQVISKLLEKRGKNACVKRMISQVYLEFPEIIFVDQWQERMKELNFTQDEISCVLDTVSHALLTSLAATQQGKDWAKKTSHEIEICLRKLTSVHPTLMLRQLPLMGTLLEGRTHLQSGAFHLQNHHVPFVAFLGLLDLMQPHVHQHFGVVKGMLALYFKLFQNYGYMKDYSSSLSRFAVLLHNFLSASPKEVKEFLNPYYNSLRELSNGKYYLDVYPLQNLLSFLVPPSMTSDLCPTTPGQMKSFGTDANAKGFVKTMGDRFLHSSNDDELIPILQDLETYSARNPVVLGQFSEHLSPLLSSESDCCRNQALSLILRHITYNPGACNLYFEAMVQALQSKNSHVRDTVLEKIHEFVVLCQENGEDLLMKIFDLGVHCNIDVTNPLKKCLSMLRSYTATN